MVAERPEFVNRTTATGRCLKALTAEDAEDAEFIFSNPSGLGTWQKLPLFDLASRVLAFLLAILDGLVLATSTVMHPIDEITDQIIAAAIEVHRKFGAGLLESVYTNALGAELVARGLDVHISKPVSLEHEGLHTERAFVIDLLVNESVIVEVKSVQKLTEIDFAQTLTYLRLTDLRVGLLINFNVPLLKNGIRRVVNRHVDQDGNELKVSRECESVDEVRERVDRDQPPTRETPRPPRTPR